MKRIAALLFMFSLCILGANTLYAYDLSRDIHGRPVSCRNLPEYEQALYSHSGDFFANWTEEDYRQLRLWVNDCYSGVFRQRIRIQKLALVDAGYSDFRERQEKEAKKQAALQMAYISASHRADVCLQSNQSKIHVAQERIVYYQQKKSEAVANLNHERRIADVSGSVDLLAEHQDGETIVNAEDEIARNWRIYKSLGGPRDDLEKINHDMKNPCF